MKINTCLAACSVSLLFSGCWTVSETEYPDVEVTRLPAGKAASVSLSGFEVDLQKYVPVEGHEQMKTNASKDPKIITGVLNRSIQIGKVRKRRASGKSITIGVHRKEEGAYYATPVEYGHGGPAPAPAHPFIRPAYDTRQDEAYEIIRDGLRDAIDQL